MNIVYLDPVHRWIVRGCIRARQANAEDDFCRLRNCLFHPLNRGYVGRDMVGFVKPYVCDTNIGCYLTVSETHANIGFLPGLDS